MPTFVTHAVTGLCAGKTVFFFLITASHGILDAFTSGGLGIALLSPISNQRFFSPWGLRVMISEFLIVWIPSIVIVTIATMVRRRHRRS